MRATLASSPDPRDMMFVVLGRSGAWPAGPVRPGGGTLGVMSTDVGPEPDEAAVAADLVRRIAAGDATAEGQLVERYRRGLLYLLRRLGALPDLADDLQQETFRIVIERLRQEGLADPAGLAPFLRGTARNLLIAERRKAARRRTWGDTGELAEAVAPAPSQLQSVLLDEEAEIVRKLIGELPTDRDRQLLLRFYVGEEDKESICTDLGLDSLHFNRVLFRARQRFKELLERFEKRQARA
ncbi:MAG: polymerase sigma-70 factor, subfamily [Acidobacteriota bacterium]|nr:polymerase sigma-70 factor, subfamily [Acidobacteriota bacterium]